MHGSVRDHHEGIYLRDHEVRRLRENEKKKKKDISIEKLRIMFTQYMQR